MPITLKITSYHRLTPGQQESFQTELQRFSVGRGANNHWTIPDPQLLMSRTHCWFENRNGSWFVTDTSSHGVFVNGSAERLTRNEHVAVSHGDQIRIGDYEIEILLHADMGETEPKEQTLIGNYEQPFASDKDEFSPIPAPPPPAPPAELKKVNTPLSHMDKGLLGGSASIDSLFKLDEEKAPEPPPSLASMGEQGSPLRQHFVAPSVSAPPPPASDLPDKYAADLSQIPDNWDDESGVFKQPADLRPEQHSPAPVPPTPPFSEAQPTPPAAAQPARHPVSPPQAGRSAAPPLQPPAEKIRGGDSAMAAFASGAGVELSQLKTVSEEVFFQNLGEVFKIMTEGLMQAVKSRSQVKSEFRLDQTMIAPTRNNPLKFSVSVEEAIARMVNQADQAYLSGVHAASEAIDDINTHQLAVLAGTEAALKSILLRFKPTTLELKFNKNAVAGKSLSMLKKAKYWDFYKLLYEEISEAAEDDFQQFFGSEFSSAYQNQLEQLKLSRKG